MQTRVVFVVYKTSELEDKIINEDIIDFSFDREVADKLAEIEREKGYTCQVQKELAVTDGDSEMFIIKHDRKLDPNKAKKLRDFKDHVIEKMSGFDKRVLLDSGNLSI